MSDPNGAPPPRIEPEMKISSLKDGTIIEVIPQSEFWTSVVIVVIVLAAIPYLSYTLFKYYDVIKNDTSVSQDDKNTYEDLWIGAIVITVLLCIAVIIFISFYFKNYTKRAFAQDNISIRNAFKKISRELAQHAADEYSDQQVDNHIEDMETLGGRIMAVKNGDDWYDDPAEFKKNYVSVGQENDTLYDRYVPRPQPRPEQEPGSGVPATVQEAVNNPFGAPPGRQPTQEQLAEGRNIQNPTEKAEYYAEQGYTPEEVKKITSNPFNAPYVPW